jgi:hypothetical protein
METDNRMSYVDAARLDIATADDTQLVAAWHSHASQISYLNADDYGDDWKRVPPIAARAREIEIALRARGVERPTGNYLMVDNDRIDWETGEWSPGWYYKKLAASKASGTSS